MTAFVSARRAFALGLTTLALCACASEAAYKDDDFQIWNTTPRISK